MHGHRVELCAVGEQRRDLARLLRREVRCDAALELLLENRDAFGAALAMTDRKIEVRALGRAAIAEEHLHGVADIALVSRVILLGKSGVLANDHPAAQLVDPR